MNVVDICIRIVCVLVAIAFCGASISKDKNDAFDVAIYGVFAIACLIIALMEVI